MTTTEEMLRAIDSAHTFLFDLMNPQSTKRIPAEIRKRARRVVKHFPFSSDYMLQSLSSDQFASEAICEELRDRCNHLEADRNNLSSAMEIMQKELDETRKELIVALSERMSLKELRQEVKKRGWENTTIVG
jgi:hypothetical protein